MISITWYNSEYVKTSAFWRITRTIFKMSLVFSKHRFFLQKNMSTICTICTIFDVTHYVTSFRRFSNLSHAKLIKLSPNMHKNDLYNMVWYDSQYVKTSAFWRITWTIFKMSLVFSKNHIFCSKI